MTLKNLPSLASIAEDPELAKTLELEHFEALLADCDEQRRTAEQAKKILCAYLRDRYVAQITAAYDVAGKEFGAVHALVDGYDLEVDTGKKVEWDQAGLAQLEARIRTDGDDPAEYIKVERKVEEKAFTSWPKMLRDTFIPHRVVKPGSVTVKLSKIAPAELV